MGLRGFDPKDCDIDNLGYEGAFVGYPFHKRIGAAECVVMVTGMDASLDCIYHMGSVFKRATVGYNESYAQYTIKPNGGSC